MRRHIILYLLLVAVAGPAFGVIAKPGSGVHGDEYYNYRTDAHGVRLPSRVPPLSRPRMQPEMEATFPTKGEVRSIVILVNYTDVKFVTPDANKAFSRMLNEEGYSANGGTGSARDYFIANSGGLFRPEFDVYGPYDLPNKRSYYKGKEAEMIVDACMLADEDGADFTQYDVNKDGNIDNVFVYYAGLNPAEGGPEEAVWPHRSYAVVVDEEKDKGYKYSIDDVWIWDYACTSELTGDRGTRQCGIGTFCHEFSHVLGLADLYNTANSEIYTVGEWDIMCSGNYNNNGRTPPSYSAYERWIVGWLKPEQLTVAADYMLEPIETSGKAYLIADAEHNMEALSPRPKEYWLLENRQAVGWDAPEGCLPGTGMLISHITFHKSKWNNNTPNNTLPLGYDICEAFYKDPYKSSASDTYPGLYDVRTFTPVSNDGNQLSWHALTNIQQSDDKSVRFHYGEDDGSGLHLLIESAVQLNTAVLKREPSVYEVKPVTVSGHQLQDSLVFFKTSDRLFQISLDSINWSSDTLWDRVREDSTYHGNVYLRFDSKVACVTQNGTLYVGTRNRLQTVQTIMKGSAVRQTLIREVTSRDATGITPYSFTAQWDEQQDADTYYLTLYTIEDKSTTETLDIKQTMRKTGDTYRSQRYPLDISSITVTIEHSYTLNKTKTTGLLTVEGLNGSRWEKADSVKIRATGSIVTNTTVFGKDKNYSRFRLTYKLLEGEGEILLRSVAVTTDRQPVYIYSGTAFDTEGKTGSVQIDGLKPGTDYYYYLCSHEEKGCEPHTSEPGTVTHVRTLPGEADTDTRFTIGINDGKVTAYFAEKVKEDRWLLLFDSSGRLTLSVAVDEGATQQQIPSDGLIRGRLYLVKCATEDGMARKDIWAKFVY